MTEAVDDGRVYGEEGGTTDQIIDPWCDLCYDETGQETDAAGFCPECNSFLCLSCIKAHDKMPTLRNHLIKRGARMPSSQSEKPVKYPDCAIHAGKVNDQFCLNHGQIKCRQCIEDTHLLCGAGTISDLCKTIDQEDFINLRELVNCIHSTSVSTKTTLERNINDIKSRRSQVTKEVEEVQDKIIEQVKEHCSEIVTKINNITDHNLFSLFEHVALLSDINDCLDKTLSETDKKINVKCEPNLFIRMQDIVAHVNRCKTELENIKKQLNISEPSFSVSAEVSAFISGNCQVGELIEEPKETEIVIPQLNIAFPQPSSIITTAQSTTSDISSITASKSGYIDVKFADDQMPCDIYGMSLTNQGTILLADFTNKKVKAVSSDNQLLSFLTFSESPGDVSVLNRLTAVAGTSDGKLHMLNISDVNSISILKTIDLGYPITGPLRDNHNLIIARWKKQPSVKMLAADGKEVWSISVDNTGQKLFTKPFSLACNTIADRNTIIVTDWGKDTLTLLDANNGQLIRTVDVKGKRPHGLTVDNKGNVYVCFINSAEICVWSDDLQRSKILLSDDNLNGQPRAVSYRSSTDCLIVSYRDVDTIDFFQLQYK